MRTRVFTLGACTYAILNNLHVQIDRAKTFSYGKGNIFMIYFHEISIEWLSG